MVKNNIAPSNWQEFTGNMLHVLQSYHHILETMKQQLYWCFKQILWKLSISFASNSCFPINLYIRCDCSSHCLCYLLKGSWLVRIERRYWSLSLLSELGLSLRGTVNNNNYFLLILFSSEWPNRKVDLENRDAPCRSRMTSCGLICT